MDVEVAGRTAHGVDVLDLGFIEQVIAGGKNMLSAAREGFINATDLADYLTKKGIPFRVAYKAVGQIVGYCVQNGTVLEELPLDVYKQFHEAFEEDLFAAIDLKYCVDTRISQGGTGSASVEYQLSVVEQFLQEH